MDIVIAQMLTFGAVLMFVIGLDALLKGGNRVPDSAFPWLLRVFDREIDAIGKTIGPSVDHAFPGQTFRIGQDLIAADLRLKTLHVRGLQGLASSALAVLGGAGVFVLSLQWHYGVLTFVILAVIGWVYPVTWVAGRARRRKDAMSRALPFAIDLITAAMQAGQDFGAAVRQLVSLGQTGPLRQEFSVMLRQIELGKSRLEALRAMADRIQLDEFRSLVTSVTQSTEMGAGIAETLKIQGEEIRRARHHKAERQAARAPSLMLIPVALFILPAVFIVIITPVILRIKDSGLTAYFQP
jgi:tight adherence protein C